MSDFIQKLSDDELDGVAGGISFSRYTETSGVLHYNGQDYPFSDYAGMLAVAQSCASSGQTSDDELFNAFRAAGLI